MLRGLRQWLQRCGCDFPLTVYSKDPEDTRLRHGVRVLDNRYAGGRRARLQKWLRHRLALFTHRFFILGGGDLLRDDPERDVAGEWLQPLEQAIRANRRTLVLGISVGKLWRPETKARIKTTLAQVDLIAVRDRTSQQRLIDLGVPQTVHVMSDLALETIVPTDHRHTNDSPPHIGISVRPVAGRNGETSDASFYQHLATVADDLVETHGATIHLLPFQAYPDDFRQRYRPPVDDEAAIAEVVRRSRHGDQLQVVPRIDQLDQLIQRISQLDVMVGTRLHAVILAAGLGVPMVAIEYAPKVRGFMEAINQARWSIPLEDFTAQRTLTHVNEILSASVAVRQKLIQDVQAYRRPMADIDRLLKQVLL